MENFNWTQFTKRIAVQSDLSIVYSAWTKSSELEKWFLSRASFYKINDESISPFINAASNDKYEWKWFAQDYVEKGKITQANCITFFEFTFAGNCLVQINLKQENDYIMVELTQKNIPIDDGSKENIRLGFAFGWTFYLINLKSVLEGGIDLRNKDAAIAGVVNG